MTIGVEIGEDREAQVGTMTVRRALPRRGRRTVGAWCFADHMGPVDISTTQGVDVAPHPHIGLQTVTWLLDGQILHRDSIGSEQVIRPGQLNLMSAGNGVSHSEENTHAFNGSLHGVQLWVAQPEVTRNSAPAFEHHADLPQLEIGAATATLLLGEFMDAFSPARRDSDLVGLELTAPIGRTALPLRADFEYAVLVLSGAVTIGDATLVPGMFGYLGSGHGECPISSNEPTRLLLLGGVPFEEPILMWWNFVGRDRDEMLIARKAWQGGDDRFGRVASELPRIEAPPTPWPI